MFCVNCGVGNQTGKFCSNCGQQVQAPPVVPPPATPSAQPPFPVAPPATGAPTATPPAGSPPPFAAPAPTPSGAPPLQPPPPPMPGPASYGAPGPSSSNSGKKVGLIAGAGAVAALLVGGALFFGLGGTPDPEIDMARPDSRLMNLNDFGYDMTFRDEVTPLEERSYPAFGQGEGCPADGSMARILDRGQVIASRYYKSGDTLIQYVDFEQVIFEFPSAGSLESVIDTIRQGYSSGLCDFQGDFVTSRLYGLSEGPDTFEVIGDTSIVFNKDTVYETSFLDATVRGINVWVVQDNYLFITSAALDIDVRNGISYQQLFRSVEDAISKAYASTG